MFKKKQETEVKQENQKSKKENKQKCQETKRESKERNNKTNKTLIFPKWFTIIMFLLVLIEVSFLGFLYFIILREEMYGNEGITENIQNSLQLAAESTLLTTGLTIIGLAIAVWTGLNIANAIDRKTIDELQRKSEKLSDDHEKIKSSIDNFKSFLQYSFELELLKTSEKLLLSKYFYDCFSKKEEAEKITMQLINIEQQFVQVYELHGSAPTGNGHLKEKAKNGINKIKKFRAQEADDLSENVTLYLLQREADFYLYSGYESLINSKALYNSFLKAANIYKRLMQEFNILDPLCYDQMNIVDNISASIKEKRKENNERKLVVLKITEEKLGIAIFLANSIGESYSKIIQNYRRLINQPSSESDEESKKEPEKITKELLYPFGYQAIFFLECATEWTSNNPEYKKEVYFRNLGCAYERMENFEGTTGKYADDILKNYKNSFHLAINNDKISPERITYIFHVILSYHNKYVSHLIEEHVKEIDASISNAITSKNWWGFVLSAIKNEPERWTSIFNDDEISYLNDMLAYSELGMQDKTRNPLCYVMNGFAYTYILLLKYAGVPNIANEYSENAEVYLKKIKKNLSFLCLFREKPDNYTNQLKERYELLSFYWNLDMA